MTVLVALVVTGALFAWFLRLERNGPSVVVVAVVFGIVLAESVIYQSQNTIPGGLVHPEFHSFSFRLIDIVIPAALLARALHRTRGRPVNVSILLWGALGVWLVGAGLLGAYEGNSLKLVGFHGKAIVYLGALVLTATVPLREYLAPGRLERFLTWTSAVALVFFATDVAGISVTRHVPLVPLTEFGTMGSDAATIFTSLGILAVALALLADSGRGRLFAIALPLLVAPAVADQRAAFIALAVSLAVVVVVMTFSRRQVRVTPTSAGLAALAVTGLLLLPSMGQILTGGEVTLPLQSRLTTTFTSYEEVLTTQDRLNQWHAARPLIEQRPILGWGLGKEYLYYDPGFQTFDRIDLTHNIFGDLLLRSGLVGLGLFLLALASTSVALARGWSWRESDRAAAFALGAGAIVAGLIGKGMAESIFEKYRLCVVLGLGLGLMISAGLPSEARPPVRRRVPAQRAPSTSEERISPRIPARL
jgi:O-antigen ligase